MPVFVVLYFYPDGTFAGVVGARRNREDADTLVRLTRMSGYDDCVFSVCEVEL